MSQLIDQVEIEVLSGDGGNGAVMWRKEKYEPMGGPYGGNGGRGGSVFIEATLDLSTLVDFRFKQKFEAEPGIKGGNKNCHGKGGKDIVIRVPVGTVIRDLDKDKVIADLIKAGQRVMVAEGGYGGKGNCELATPTKRAPHYCEPGQPGIARRLQMTLKLLADVGIIGLPNAGKSTLLAAATRAKPKIADYPFTTLAPNLGVVRVDDRTAFVVADFPGLIPGASDGAGLGFQFLRHVSRVRVFVHLVAFDWDESRDPVEDYESIRRELEKYDAELLDKPEILVLNKAELAESPELLAKLTAHAEKKGRKVMAISAVTGQGVKELIYEIAQILKAQKAAETSNAETIELRRPPIFDNPNALGDMIKGVVKNAAVNVATNMVTNAVSNVVTKAANNVIAANEKKKAEQATKTKPAPSAKAQPKLPAVKSAPKKKAAPVKAAVAKSKALPAKKKANAVKAKLAPKKKAPTPVKKAITAKKKPAPAKKKPAPAKKKSAPAKKKARKR